MKIVFNVSAMNSGGAERVVSLLSDEFCKRGHDVTILMLSTNEFFSFYPLNPQVTLLPLLTAKNKGAHFFKRVKLMRRIYSEIKPDIVIAFLPHVCIYTHYALKKAKIPYILSERNDPNQYNFIYKILLKKAFKKANGCVFQTHDCLKWYRKNKKKPTDAVIFNPINLSFSLGNVDYKHKKKNVLFVGRFDKQKNYALLLKSFQIFSLKNPDFVLDVYGDGPDKQCFLKLARSLDIFDKIKYHGKNSNWRSIEYNSSLFVSTSIYEGMPNSLAEAASLNIPCVATDCPIGGSRQLANLFNNIYLVENKCSESVFAKKMEEVMHFNSLQNVIPKEVQLSFVVGEWEKIIKEAING